jgi:ApaG protein
MATHPRYQFDVTVRTRFLGEQSRPQDGHYVFAYAVTIRNAGKLRAQLLSRHWLIRDADGRVDEVRGDGVVGMQPDLAPGESFEYTSGAIIATAVGTMQGSYRIRAADGVEFDAPIAPFTLSVPRVLH